MRAEELLVNIAKTVGIQMIGVADLEKVDSFNSFFESIPKGSIAFYNQDSSLKVDIKKQWKKTKSVIGFACSYNTTELEGKFSSDRGIFAKCTWGKDYHEVLRKRAKLLMDEFTKTYPCDYRVFVDTGKLSDRVIAYASGIGFYGKNHFIINPTYGSYIYLGSILVDIDLESDGDILESQCGDCTKCLDVCPLKANAKDTFEFEKCVSYMTQKAIDDNPTRYLYGCDLCQKVCRFNDNKITDEDFSSDEEKYHPLLNDIINMGEDRFNELYEGSSMLWVGYDTIRKNALSLLQRNNKKDR